jgi:Icc-related predicted phosphoesterase
MRLLITADIHNRADWLHWVGGEKADLTLIAGDLLDGFDQRGLLPQMISLRSWVAKFERPLALSSGNHDGNIEAAAMPEEMELAIDLETDREAALDLLLREYWMDALEKPGVVTDRRSQILQVGGENVVVTTLPFFPGSQGPRLANNLWETGYKLRQESQARWIVLNHEPPAHTKVGGPDGDISLFYKIQEFQPDYVVSGHLHSQPYFGSFSDQIGRTRCLNPGGPIHGSAHLAKIPNHIILDTKTQEARWHAMPRP